MLTIEDVAKICHTANKELCEANADYSQLPWGSAPSWQRTSAINGVTFFMQNPDSAPGELHVNWVKEKVADGWKYGDVKNAETKEHPCLVDFEKLPAMQQAKDHLFRAICMALTPFIGKTAGIEK